MCRGRRRRRACVYNSPGVVGHLSRRSASYNLLALRLHNKQFNRSLKLRLKLKVNSEPGSVGGLPVMLAQLRYQHDTDGRPAERRTDGGSPHFGQRRRSRRGESAPARGCARPGADSRDKQSLWLGAIRAPSVRRAGDAARRRHCALSEPSSWFARRIHILLRFTDIFQASQRIFFKTSTVNNISFFLLCFSLTTTTFTGFLGNGSDNFTNLLLVQFYGSHY